MTELNIRAKRSEDGNGIDLFGWVDRPDHVDRVAVGLNPQASDEPVTEFLTLTEDQARRLLQDLLETGLTEPKPSEEPKQSAPSSPTMPEAWQEIIRLNQQHTEDFRRIVDRLLPPCPPTTRLT